MTYVLITKNTNSIYKHVYTAIPTLSVSVVTVNTDVNYRMFYTVVCSQRVRGVSSLYWMEIF